MSLDIRDQICPLCGAADVSELCQDGRRKFLSCRTCNLVFVPAGQFLSSGDEKARYDLHQNSPDDPGYRRFLSRLFIPMQERLAAGSYGLDFGSGPGPTLSVMFEEMGHTMAIYDYCYATDRSVLENQYDFITATEVLEHLHNPKEDLDRLWTSLKPGGWLGVMTKLAPDREAFARWTYKNDATHVCFFSGSTFEWLAAQWQAEITFVNRDVILFYKKMNTPAQSKLFPRKIRQN